MSPQGWERVQGLRRVVYDSADCVEGLKAFKEKRKPVYRGNSSAATPGARPLSLGGLPRRLGRKTQAALRGQPHDGAS